MATKVMTWGRGWLKASETFLEHAAAVSVGFVMMAVGLAMGVTLVLLPIGIVVGLMGVAIFVAGLFAHPWQND